MTQQALLNTDLPLANPRHGKVRDLYDLSLHTDGVAEDALLLVASDRLSAFDVVMPNGVPGKGVVLTQISMFWFNMIAEKFGSELKHHVLSTDPADIEGISDAQRKALEGRVMIGRRTEVVPIECVARGYLAGSGWKEYQESGTICGVDLPKGLKQCDKLPRTIFTPATKAETGHDENISFRDAVGVVGKETMQRLRYWTTTLYEMAHKYAAQRGIILADTKFEFGIDAGGDLVLIDEVLTPDSSRFWPADQYEPGRDQTSFDKQYVRNYLEQLVSEGKWNKTPPGPQLPDDVVNGTLDRYLEAYRILTGSDLKLP